MHHIPLRDPQLDFSDVRMPWHRHGYVVSRFLDAQSLLFPEGEKFFVDSVARFRNSVPVLAKEISAFAAQESMHRKYHAFYNQTLEKDGIPIPKLEKKVHALFRGFRALSAKSQLAITVCFEHYTAIISSLSLSDPLMWESAEAERTRLWQWHALEELEHRSVAFDVYRSLGGGYFRRSFWMLVLSGLYLGFVGVNLATMLAHDRKLFSPRIWFEGAYRLYLRPGPLRRLFPSYLAFFRPGFHPRDIATPTLAHFQQIFTDPRRRSG